MSEIILLFKHELQSFLKSGKSSLFLLLFTVCIWGIVIAEKVDTIESAGSFIWILFFALVVGAGSNTKRATHVLQ